MDVKIFIVIYMVLTPSFASATNGYFSHGYGAINKSLGGAGAAWSQDSLSAATNPAGMNSVGNKIDFGAELFSPRRGYSVRGKAEGEPPVGSFYLREGTYTSGSNYAVIPNFGYNRELADGSTIGVSIYANGINTDYSEDTFYGGDSGVDLVQVFVAPTYSWRVNENQALGVSPIFVFQNFEYKGVSQFASFSADGTKLSDNGPEKTWGYGLSIGWQGDLSRTVRAGVSYRTKVYMEKLKKYSGFFAEQGRFDVPESLTVGIAWRSYRHSILFDIQHIAYGDIKSSSNRLLPNLQVSRLGDDDGAGFGWKDMTIYKLGYQFDVRPTTSLRVGLNYGEQLIRDPEILVNLMSPAFPELHYTAGFSEKLSEKWEINGVVYFVKKGVLTAPNALGEGQTLSAYMYQIAAGLSFTYLFRQ